MERAPSPEASTDFEVEPADVGAINIGEPMNPVDMSTWLQSEKTGVINIGGLVDADDPFT